VSLGAATLIGAAHDARTLYAVWHRVIPGGTLDDQAARCC